MAKEKKEKKSKSSKKSKIEDPVVDAMKKVSKKEKKDKGKASKLPTDKLLEHFGRPTGTSDVEKASEAIAATSPDVVESLLVPFAHPLANEKTTKKVLKVVKKGAKNKSLKRGVKEVVKALRKSPTNNAPGIVILAADISPMDVISHIPILCEDHGIPYIFVSSRAELGAAGATKRPTSVVMVLPSAGKKEAAEEGFREAYDEIVKTIGAEMAKVKY